MFRRPNDLIVVIVAAVLCAILTQVAAAVPLLRLLGALPLVLFLPGYAITIACFPTRSLGVPEQILLSLGISFSVAALSGLVLYWLHLGLWSGTWAIVLSLIVVCATAVAWKRRKRSHSATASLPKIHLNVSFRDSLLLGLAVLVTAVAVGLARMPTPPSGVSGYTLLWMIPAGDGNTNDYRLGVNSLEFSATTYRLQVTVDGQTAYDWPDLRLAPGGSWETPIALPSDRAGVVPVEAMLYRLDNPDVVYRWIKLQHGE